MQNKESQEKKTAGRKLNLGPTGKAALLAAALAANAAPAVGAETKHSWPQAQPMSAKVLESLPNMTAQDEFADASVPKTQTELDAAAARERESKRIPNGNWNRLNVSINETEADEKPLPEPAEEAGFTGARFAEAAELTNGIKNQSELDTMLADSRGALNKGLTGVNLRIPGADKEIKSAGDVLVVTAASLANIELSHLLNHGSERLNPDSMPFSKTWGEMKDGKGWTLKAGVNPLEGIRLKFDPAVGIVFQQKF